MRQIVSKAVASDEVIDIFAAAGLKKPDISILSDEFLAEVRGPAAQEPGRRALAEAPERRDQDADQEEPRPGPLVLRDAREVDPGLSEPGHRDGADHRGADPARQGDARSRRSAARTSG